MVDYDFKSIEGKWQRVWSEQNYGKSEDFPASPAGRSDKPKFYSLIEFPYPSGAGLHVGHCMMYSATDAHARMMRMRGFNVMFPMGWDAFGLPTENFAIKNKVKPADVTAKSIATFKRQQKSLGYSFDWSREINTTDPEYYKWTQWIFLQFYKHAIIDGKLTKVDDDDTVTPRLAFQAEMPVNWCPSCKIVLANEEVVNGACERCGTQAIKRKQKQWMLRITAYAERLIDDLKLVDFPQKTKTMQENWIGKSVGAEIEFAVVISTEAEKSSDKKKISPPTSSSRDDKNSVRVFTTRADTLFGCTYIVLSPEYSGLERLLPKIKNKAEVETYIDDAKKKSDLERTELQKEKTGVKLDGLKAINPINNEEVDIYIADYVLASYGTGAVMAVPAHDERDFEFAKKYDIPIKQVIAPLFTTDSGPDAVRPEEKTIRRPMINAIVKHWKEDKIYCLDWEKYNWHSFVLGGIEEGETAEDAAIREVKEETGFQNIKSAKTIGFETHSNFFAHHKNINRYSISKCVVVELSDDKFVEPNPDDVKNHKGLWIDTPKVKNFVNLENGLYFWDIYKNGDLAFTDYGVLINSGEFNDLSSEDAKKNITERLKKIGAGNFTTNFKLRDWIFSRQHYWGEPIPIIHCEQCGMVPVPESELPVTLPDVENYLPTETGESPLAKISDWVNTTCPKCDGKAKRETDTMPNWAGSSWYFLRYCDPKNDIKLADPKKLEYWMPVDLYNGGAEHTTLHLLYSRFWHKFLYDLKVVGEPEPYKKRVVHGLILGPDGQKMSKSRGNVINPDEMVEKFGADTLRAYIMFIGPYDQESAWSMAGVQGVSRFLKRVWKSFDLIDHKTDDNNLLTKLNQTIIGITYDLDNFKLNTVISKLMELLNTIEKTGHISENSYAIFLKLLYPAAPHIASELWTMVYPVKSPDFENEIKWPEADQKYLTEDKVEIVVQINGKVKDRFTIDSDATDKELEDMAFKSEKVAEYIQDREIIKVIVIPKKLVSIVIKM